MDNRSMTLRYDAVGDVLFVDLVPRHDGQEFAFIEDLLVGRFNSATGKVEGFEALFFARESASGSGITLPLDAVLEPETQAARPA